MHSTVVEVERGRFEGIGAELILEPEGSNANRLPAPTPSPRA